MLNKGGKNTERMFSGTRKTEGKQVQVAYEQSTQEYDFCKPM
jgi:hypothetical protein